MAGMDGPGKRDVQGAEAFVLSFPLRSQFRGLVKCGAPAALRQWHQVRTVLGAAVLGPHQRQEHHLELQALAAMQGHQLHALRIRLQPGLALVGAVGIAFVAALVAQPGQQFARTTAAFGALLQQLAQVDQIGEFAFAAGRRQQSRGRFLRQLTSQAEYALAPPAFAQRGQARRDGGP